MKRIAIGMAALVLALCVLCMTALAAGDGSLSVSVDKTTVKTGETVTVTLSVASNPGIATMAAHIAFDPDVFTVESKTVGSLLVNNTNTVDQAGVAGFDLGDDTATANVTGTGAFGTVVLKVKDGAALGKTTITIANDETRDVDIAKVTMAGSSVELTITAGAHTHNWGEGVETTPATCEGKGVKTFTCTICGETKTEDIPATGHDWDEGTIETPAACESKGVKKFTCKNDASHTKTEDIPATGHKWDAGKVTKDATCKEEGVKTYTCENDPTHTKTETIAKTDHTWDAGVVTTEPACRDEGVRTFTCTVCGEKKTESIPKTGVHTIDPVADKTEAKDATTTEKGNIEYWTCSVCGKLFLDADGKTETTLAEVQYDAQYKEEIQLGEVSEEDEALLTETASGAGYDEDHIALVEATLMVSFDNGETWEEAAEADIPSGGVLVAFDYPEGTNAKDYDFIIFHKKADGTIETLTPKEGAKLTVKVTSLSPFAIAWKDAEKAAAGGGGGNGGTTAAAARSTPPKTGDETNIALWLGVFMFCAACAAVLLRKRNN